MAPDPASAAGPQTATRVWPHADQGQRYQTEALARVSRTFALTIPQLPRGLREAVANAYLVCRLADTIEDEPALSVTEKAGLLEEFAEVVAGGRPSEAFAGRLGGLLSPATAEGERDLVAHTALVLDTTHRLRPAQRAAIERCINVMTAGMAQFGGGTSEGLATVDDLDRYTYCVAGVVGEMITDLACDHSPAIARHRERLYSLSARFGGGLQLVNIIKDVWEDQRRGACWLPRTVFASGLDLSSPAASREPAFIEGLSTLAALARDQLDDALEYTLLIPARERGIRRFMIWSLGLAVLTLRRIAARPGFASGDQVRIPRRQVWATVYATSAAAGSDAGLRWLYRRASASLRQGR